MTLEDSPTSSATLSLIDAGCPACGSHHRTDLGPPRGRMNATFQRFADDLSKVTTARCQDCSALYLAPMVHYSGPLRHELYNIDYWDAGQGVTDLKNMKEKDGILDIVARFAGSLAGKSLLDIGCGTGEYLQLAAKRGMRVTGSDVDQSMADYVAERYGHRVVVGLFDENTFPPESFDVIVLSHVVEHLAEPSKMLRSIHRALKPDGLFVMCTPNFDSLMERLHDLYGRVRHGRGKSYYLEAFISPFHVVGFNKKSARRILERTGFRPAYVKVHSGLEWDNSRTSLPVFAVTVAGALLGRGMALNTISRKA